MPELNHSGKFWGFVTLGAAVLSSPLWVHLSGRGEERPSPIEVVVKMPSAEAPKQQASVPAVSTSFREDRPSVAPAPAWAPPRSPGGGLASSERYLTAAELEGFSNWQLTIARNEIYARHGRRFRRADLQRYFDAQDWYRPAYGPDEFSDDQLNAFEQYNANLIADFQRRKYGAQ